MCGASNSKSSVPPVLLCPQGTDYFVPTIDWMSDHLVKGIRRYLPVSRDGRGREAVGRPMLRKFERE